MTSHQRRPGLLLIGPRLKDPTPESTLQFLRWTKLHFRDLVNVPTDPIKGSITHALRFTAPTTDDMIDISKNNIKGKANTPSYSHDETKGFSPNFYTCLVDDISILQDEPYYALSRALDLENKRALSPDEEPVGQSGQEEVTGKMIFDIVDAKFAVYEEVETSSQYNGPYQTLPLPLLLPTGDSAPIAQPPRTYLVGTTIKTPGEKSSALPAAIEKLQKALTWTFKREIDPRHLIYTSVYRHDADAQPRDHPAIHDSCDVAGMWLIVVLLVESGSGRFLEYGEVEEMAGRCVAGYGDGDVKGLETHWGVWRGELFVGKGV